MSSTDSGRATSNRGDGQSAAAEQMTLSQLIARILNQLSVSSWLPAAAFVFLLLFVGSVRASRGDVPDAIKDIASMGFESLLLLVGAVILTTMLTQAFEFEAIRLLEGYWGPGRLRSSLADFISRLPRWNRNRLRQRKAHVVSRAFPIARTAMLDAGISRSLVDVIEDEWILHRTPTASKKDLQKARMIRWELFAPVSAQRQLDRLTEALRFYPTADRRIRPTRLGNTLTAYEERAFSGPGDLEGFVQEVIHELPVTIQDEHDQFRSRLDLYCALVIVFAVSGVIGICGLVTEDKGLAAIAALLAGGLSLLSYRAAVASARAYGRALETIAKISARQR